MATRRQREQREARRAKYRQADEDTTPPAGPPSEYVKDIESLRYGSRVVLSIRVSTPEQKRKGEIAGQENYVRYRGDLKGCKVVDVVYRIGPGDDLSELKPAIHSAKKRQAAILAESLDRILRPSSYTRENQRAVPDADDFAQLKKIDQGVPIYTCLHPDTPYEKVRGHQTARNLKNKKEKERRYKKKGFKKKQKEKWGPRVSELHTQGVSLRRIARIVSYESGIPLTHDTIRVWVNNPASAL